ncbi:DUF3857 domain-containing protein [Sphingobacterium phlebotomi]|uniref:DUF3857 domain-containing protein n=1 Tax=Sphingobacterium phlebotomi TaxID=2605433 RepID=A0A5D4H5Q7_9SPHI|nr:DUF3857 domain-containing protein [Sphingobacterium phlebotomi]TYR35612.1 DUF3857 domain-containing protein [Sphingobacterium phlebotomi]
MKLYAFLYLLAFCFLSQNMSYASEPKLTKAKKPAWLRVSDKQAELPNLEDISDGYYYEKVEYQVNLANQTRFYGTVKTIVENAGTENAGQINIFFDPQYQTLTLHELYIVREGKQMDRLDLNKFKLMASETELSRSIYNGTYSAYLLLEDLRKDDKIVMSYSLKGFNPVFGNKFFDTYFLQSYEPIGALHVNYIVPKDRQLRFKSFVGAPQASQQDLGNSTSYYWDIAGTEKVDYEFYTPLWHSTRQRIECSEFKGWMDVAKWAADVNPIPELKHGGELQQFVEKLWENANDDSTEYLKLVADFVQNEIRYMGVEVGEYSHRANTPENVFRQRYGDCKDKSVLMGAMLKSKDIESTLVLVNSYEEYGLKDYLPSPSAFNHVVLYVSIDERGQYIDPTIPNQGGNIRNRYFPFYGKVLWAKKGEKLRDTEHIVAGNTRVEERFYLQKDGSAQLDVSTIYIGTDADNIRSYFKQTAKNQIEKSYVQYYQGLYKQLTKRSALTFEDDLLNNIFYVEEYYDIKSFPETDAFSNRRAISLYSTNLSNYLPDVTDMRIGPIALQYPLSLEHDIYVINPEGIAVPPLRESSFLNRDSYYFGKTITTQQDTLKIAYRLGAHDTYVKVADVNQYIADFANKHELFSLAVYLDNDGFVVGSTTQGKNNFWAMAGFVGLLALFTILVMKFYNPQGATSLIPMYDELQYDRIGGWLIVLLIVLVATLFRTFFVGMVQLFFKEDVWSALQYNIGVPPFLYVMLIILEFVSNTGIIFLCGYCVYLMLKRRDIFPQTLFFLLMFQLVFVVLDTILAAIIFKQSSNVYDGISESFRAIIFALIWSLYIFNSTRVKGTFLVASTPQASEEIYYTEIPSSVLPEIPTSIRKEDSHNES